MTYVLISAGLDLSVAPVFALGGIIASITVTNGVPAWLSILIGTSVGAITGLINGVLIVWFNIPALIVTLGMMYMARGTILIITQGVAIYPLTEAFNTLGQGNFLEIPYVIWIALILAIFAHLVLVYTPFGRAVYAIGGNEETSRLAGLNVY